MHLHDIDGTRYIVEQSYDATPLGKPFDIELTHLCTRPSATPVLYDLAYEYEFFEEVNNTVRRIDINGHVGGISVSCY